MPRPKLPLDETVVWNLAIRGCSFRQIAAVCGCDVSTLSRRFATLIREGWEFGGTQLLDAIYDVAVVHKNPQILKFAAQNRLGWSDKSENRNMNVNLDGNDVALMDEAEVGTKLATLSRELALDAAPQAATPPTVKLILKGDMKAQTAKEKKSRGKRIRKEPSGS